MKKLIAFAQGLGVNISPEQASAFEKYAGLIMQKRDFLNVTNVSGKTEIFNRHLADGVYAWSVLGKYLPENPVIADAGAGGGYIGVTIKILAPRAKMYMFESVRKKCSFLDWAGAELGLADFEVRAERLEKNTPSVNADCVIERAMGQLADIAQNCLAQVKPDGIFAAYQGGEATKQAAQASVPTALMEFTEYTLPSGKEKRHFAVFKNGHSA
ncbi:MAG: RsmG family class I SAM-dependent methyltransferase [Elusimicrobiaceae bacterium]